MWFPTKCTDIFGSLSVVTNHARSAARPDASRPTRTSGVNSDDHHVHVAEVERQRVAHGQLPDLGQRLEPVEAGVGVGGLPGSES